MSASAAPEAARRASTLLPVRQLARGGMGTVELALRHEGAFGRLCAVKRPHPHLLDDEDVRAMFLDEARIAGIVRHANVVSVLDVGEDERGPYLVMDYIEGVTLSAIIGRQAKTGEQLPLQLCARIVADVARGLAAAHELRDHDGSPLELVHRDVSPSNVLVGFDGSVKLADFGIARAFGRSAKLTALGVIKGKLGYVSPEQLRYQTLDFRADLFSLGVVLFELLAGRRLYADRPSSPAPLRILQEPPPDIDDDRDDVPPALTELLFQLLAKDAADRPASARDVAERLDAAIAALLAEETPVSTAAYMERAFVAEQRELTADLAQAIAAAQATATETPPPAPKPSVPPPLTGLVDAQATQAMQTTRLLADAGGPQRRRWWLVASATLLGALGIAGALAAARTAASATPATDPATPASAPSPAENGAAVPAPSEAARPAIEAPDAGVAPSATASAAAAHPRPGPSSRAAGKPAGGPPLWGWK